MGLRSWRVFSINVDAENQCLINDKTVCGALNRHFCHHEVAPQVNPCYLPFFCSSEVVSFHVSTKVIKSDLRLLSVNVKYCVQIKNACKCVSTYKQKLSLAVNKKLHSLQE